MLCHLRHAMKIRFHSTRQTMQAFAAVVCPRVDAKNANGRRFSAD